GRGAGWAVDAGRSTLTSTVESGAATIKIIKSTSMTSIKGVTLISYIASRASFSADKRIAIILLRGLAQGKDRRISVWASGAAAIEIAGQMAKNLGRGIAEQGAVA